MTGNIHHAVLLWRYIALQIQKGRQTTVEENRLYVKNIFLAILFCCQQGIALQGHREVMDVDDPSTNVGNFRCLMLILSQSIDIVRQKMISGPNNATWLGHDIQNSIISLLAESLRWKIREKLHTARYFTIIADETKDISKSEQLFLVHRYVFNGNTHERFISNTNCAEINAEALFTYNTSALRETDANCVSQCYDGASVISGHLTGVRTRVTDVNSSAIYIHCHVILIL